MRKSIIILFTDGVEKEIFLDGDVIYALHDNYLKVTYSVTYEIIPLFNVRVIKFPLEQLFEGTWITYL